MTVPCESSISNNGDWKEDCLSAIDFQNSEKIGWNKTRQVPLNFSVVNGFRLEGIIKRLL